MLHVRLLTTIHNVNKFIRDLIGSSRRCVWRIFVKKSFRANIRLVLFKFPSVIT